VPPGGPWILAVVAATLLIAGTGAGIRLVAARIVADARIAGGHLSQAALARQLRADGYRIANDRLRWLAGASGLEPFAAQP
jgi:hypothetical protein